MRMKSFKPKFRRSEPQTQQSNNTLMPINRPFVPAVKVGSSRAVKITPLGGVGLVQKNMFVYEYEDDIVIIDCGVGFPDEEMPGVDLIIPDISYLKDKKSKIRGIVITHAHDDHIGGLPYIWPELNVPIYSQKLTCGFIKTKFLDHKLPTNQIKTLNIDDTIKLGKFDISFYQVSHSVPDSTGIVLRTPLGILIHQSDFKVDWTPVNGQTTDVATAATVARGGVLLMTIDCLGVEKPGYTLSEKAIEPAFESIEKKTRGKLIITLMTSNITRIQQALNVASRSNRKVCLLGRSMENNFQVARDLGYLDIPPGLIINQEQIKGFKDENLMLVMAGSLGQSGSALDRAANGEHKYVQIKKTDTVVFSADPMPSAVVSQNSILNKLARIGCDVYASTITPDLHVSGHAAIEEIKLMINIVKPKNLMPMGGEFKHMKAFAKMALALGYSEDQIILPEEGQVVNVTRDKAFINGEYKTQNVYIDGLGVGDVGKEVLNDRQIMSQEGVVIVMVKVDRQTGKLLGVPELITRGFVFEAESEDLLDASTEIVKSCLSKDRNISTEWKNVRGDIENQLGRFFSNELKRNPLVLPLIMEM